MMMTMMMTVILKNTGAEVFEELHFSLREGDAVLDGEVRLDASVEVVGHLGLVDRRLRVGQVDQLQQHLGVRLQQDNTHRRQTAAYIIMIKNLKSMTMLLYEKIYCSAGTSVYFRARICVKSKMYAKLVTLKAIF